MIKSILDHNQLESGSPYRLDQSEQYATWRAAKLRGYPRSAEALLVEIEDPFNLTKSEVKALLANVCKTATTLYHCRAGESENKAVPRALGEQLGLRRMDGNLCADDDSVSALQVMPDGTRHEGYIPYTNRALNWHSDGYYNTPERRIRAMLLHCVRPAAQGGENRLLDPEIVYIQMRDENPEFIRALCHPQAMTIPENIEQGRHIRDAVSGPVFWWDGSGNLNMRYTARKRSIAWRDDPLTRQAVAFLESLLEDTNPYILRHRLQAGQGIISNNALHNRTAFSDTQPPGRLIYRVRYYDRVRDTNLSDQMTGDNCVVA